MEKLYDLFVLGEKERATFLGRMTMSALARFLNLRIEAIKCIRAETEGQEEATCILHGNRLKPTYAVMEACRPLAVERDVDGY